MTDSPAQATSSASQTGDEGGGSGQPAAALTPLRIGEPGIYSLTEDQYHADPCVLPSLSRSMIKLLVDYSPAHVRVAHPRLGNLADDEGQPEANSNEDMDVGKAAHAAFLRGENVVERVPYDDYRTKAAKQYRDEIVAAGRVPLKQTKFDHMLHLVDKLEGFRANTGAFTKGKPEQTLIVRFNDRIWGRAMVDYLEDDPQGPMWDLKTTGGRAHLDTWTRRCFEHGAHLQAYWYPMLAGELRDGEVPQTFKYVVVETKPPFAIRVFELSPQAYEVAEAQVKFGLDLWERCITDGSWPGYPLEPEWVDPPGYILRAWEWQTRTGTGLAKPRVRTGSDPAAVNRFIQAGQFGG